MQAWQELVEVWQLVKPQPHIPDLQTMAAISAARMLLHEPGCWERVRHVLDDFQRTFSMLTS